MRGYSSSECRGFESQRLLLDGHIIFLNIFDVRIVTFVWKDENKQKRRRGWPIKKQKSPRCLRRFWLFCLKCRGYISFLHLVPKSDDNFSLFLSSSNRKKSLLLKFGHLSCFVEGAICHRFISFINPGWILTRLGKL